MPTISLPLDCPEDSQVYPSILGREIVVTKAGVEVPSLSAAQIEALAAMGVVVGNPKDAGERRQKPRTTTDNKEGES